MTGPEIRKLQRRLTALGYAPGGVDGVIGPATKSALKRFQTESELLATTAAELATVYEAGKMDGASEVRMFWPTSTLPV